jgi:hypothetical protein
MALILNPYGGGTIVGKLGGKVFQRGTFGQVVRNLALPVNPAAPQQQNVRAQMAILAYNWTFVLTELQRQNWTNYGLGTPVLGKLGTSIILPGRAWFIKNNMMPMLFDNSYNPAAPLTPGMAPPFEPTFAGTVATGIRVTAFVTAPQPASDLEFKVSIPLNASKKFFKGPYVVRTIVQEGIFVLPITLKPAGTVALTQKYVIAYRIVQNDGRSSVEQTKEVTIG